MLKGKGTLPRPPQSTGSLSSGLSDGVIDVSAFESDQVVVDAAFNQSAGAPGFQRDVKGKETMKSVSSKGLSFEIVGA